MESTTTQPRLLRVSEIARMLDFPSEAATRKFVERLGNTLRTVKIGRRLRVDASAIEQIIKDGLPLPPPTKPLKTEEEHRDESDETRQQATP